MKDKVVFITGGASGLGREENDFINGENTTIDGGMTKKMIYLE